MTFDEWVRSCANDLGLTDWTISVDWGDLPEETYARVHAPRGRSTAEITLGSSFLNSTPEEKRETIIHELVHLHFTQADDLVAELLPPHLGVAAFAMFQGAFELAMEKGIESLSVAMATAFVLPPEAE